ncbi:MAG: hypothetical protein RO257_08775 [Candidatus Kapabacteria bacterium]|jgi:hypothetical protein|nr:hypothetical protein [Candidatus Kapabacteria bacterium]
MKKFISIITIIVILIIAGCSSSDSPSDSNEIRLLENAKVSIDSLLYAIWEQGDLSAGAIAAADFNEDVIRTLMKAALIKFSEIYEMAYVDSLGILKYIEPEEYRYSEGTDISSQSHVIKLFATKQRVLSNIFKLVEGYHAVVMESPILKDGKCKGSFSPIFKPHDLIGSLITEIHATGVDDFWVMDANALIIYDTDETQIGRNIYTDTLYKEFPTLHTATTVIIAGESGKTEYSFLSKEKNKVVYKDVWWRTSDYYGTKWKFCIVKERI